MLDDFFPHETVITKGTIRLQALEDLAGLNNYSNYSEITLDSGGTSVLISTNSLVYQVKVELGEWNADGTVFTPYSTVFAANAMNRDDAIILKASLSEGLPNIRIQFTSEEMTQAYFLSLHNGNAALTVPFQ